MFLEMKCFSIWYRVLLYFQNNERLCTGTGRDTRHVPNLSIFVVALHEKKVKLTVNAIKCWLSQHINIIHCESSDSNEWTCTMLTTYNVLALTNICMHCVPIFLNGQPRTSTSLEFRSSLLRCSLSKTQSNAKSFYYQDIRDLSITGPIFWNLLKTFPENKRLTDKELSDKQLQITPFLG